MIQRAAVSKADRCWVSRLLHACFRHHRPVFRGCGVPVAPSFVRKCGAPAVGLQQACVSKRAGKILGLHTCPVVTERKRACKHLNILASSIRASKHPKLTVFHHFCLTLSQNNGLERQIAIFSGGATVACSYGVGLAALGI